MTDSTAASFAIWKPGDVSDAHIKAQTLRLITASLNCDSDMYTRVLGELVEIEGRKAMAQVIMCLVTMLTGVYRTAEARAGVIEELLPRLAEALDNNDGE